MSVLEPYRMYKHMCGVIMLKSLKREIETDKFTDF